MPQVPIAQRQVEIGAAPDLRSNVNAPIETFGGGASAAAAAKSSNALLEGTTKLYEQERDAANERVFFDNDLLASQLQTKIELAVKNMHGKNAAAAPDYATKEWKGGIDEITKGMDDTQKGHILAAARVRRANLFKSTNYHVSTELNKYDDDQTEAYVKQAKSEAMLHPNDPDRVSLSIFQQESAIEKNAMKYGLSTQDIAIKKEVARSSTHLSVLDTIAESDDPDKDLKAKKYYDTHKDSFRFDDIEKAGKRVEAATKLGQTYRTSDTIFSKARNLTDAVKQAGQIQEPSLRKAVTEELSSRFSLKEKAEKQHEEDLEDHSGNVIDKTGDYEKIPESIKQQLSVTAKSRLKAYAKQKREGTQLPSNTDKYLDLRLLAANPATRDDFAKMSMSQLRGELPGAEILALTKLQEGINKGDGKTKETLGGIETTNQIVMRTLGNAGIKAVSDEGREFFRKLNRSVDEQHAATGKKPSGQEIQALMDGFLVEGIAEKKSLFGFDSLWPDSKKKAFELEEGKSFVDVEPDKIPATEKAKITDFLKRSGKPITNENILKMFNLKFGGRSANRS